MGLIATKHKITHVVRDYEKFLKSDYDAYLNVKKEREPLNEFSEFKGFDILERHLIEFPEILFFILQKVLLKDEWNWFASKRGQRWFASTFNEFAVPQKL